MSIVLSVSGFRPAVPTQQGRCPGTRFDKVHDHSASVFASIT